MKREVVSAALAHRRPPYVPWSLEALDDHLLRLRLLEHGRQEGFVLAPTHDVERDVPPENMHVFIEEALAREQQ